jgi:hypothetical protein
MGTGTTGLTWSATNKEKRSCSAWKTTEPACKSSTRTRLAPTVTLGYFGWTSWGDVPQPGFMRVIPKSTKYGEGPFPRGRLALNVPFVKRPTVQGGHSCCAVHVVKSTTARRNTTACTGESVTSTNARKSSRSAYSTSNLLYPRPQMFLKIGLARVGIVGRDCSSTTLVFSMSDTKTPRLPRYAEFVTYRSLVRQGRPIPVDAARRATLDGNGCGRCADSSRTCLCLGETLEIALVVANGAGEPKGKK